MSLSRERIFLSPPHMGGKEQKYVSEAFASNYIAPVGPQLALFEERFCAQTGFPHAVAVSSGTAAMHLVLHHLGVGSGDVVLASTLTFIGSVSPAVHLGAELRLIDSDSETWTMDPAFLRQAIEDCAEEGRLPKAVVPTDLYGQSCDVEALKEVCDEYGVPLIVDAAESLGSSYDGTHAGCGARAAIFSFNGNKIITTSGGGVVASEDLELVEHARKLATQSREPFAHFEHAEVGYNYRLSNVAAAIGLGQLEVLADRVKRKREINRRYAELLFGVSGIQMMPEADYGSSNCWLTVVLFNEAEFGSSAEEIRLALEKENIESRPMWKPMHLQPVFEGQRAYGGSVSESLFKEGLCLPSGTSLNDKDIDRICRIIRGERTKVNSAN
jgi:dTDP-4-amino-4,6-dideoxygalactose transaminase